MLVFLFATSLLTAVTCKRSYEMADLFDSDFKAEKSFIIASKQGCIVLFRVEQREKVVYFSIPFSEKLRIESYGKKKKSALPHDGPLLVGKFGSNNKESQSLHYSAKTGLGSVDPRYLLNSPEQVLSSLTGSSCLSPVRSIRSSCSAGSLPCVI